MGLPSLVLAALLASSASAQDGPGTAPSAIVKGVKSADLSGQFIDKGTRDQSVIGSCHAFAAVALLEAAYFRAQGHIIRLSEEDLFLHGTVLTGDTHAARCHAGLKCVLAEGNYVDKNLRHALEHGVLAGSQYKQFVDRWRKFREAEATRRRVFAFVRSKEFLLDFTDDEPPEPWVAYLQEEGARKEIAATLGVDIHDRDAERALIRDLFKGVQLERKEFPLIEEARIKSDKCRELGADRLTLIKAELDAGRPVAVSMYLNGLKSWGVAASGEHAYHAFALVGYKQGKKGLLFTTRNSWAGVNPPVAEHQLCRVFSVESLLVPGETGGLAASP